MFGHGCYNSHVSEPPRILFVAARYPWPANDGYRTRLANMALGLAQLGVVDVVGLSADDVGDLVDPPSASINPMVVREGALPSMSTRAWRFARGSLPSRLGRQIFADARPVIAELAANHRYDLVWLSLPDTWESVHDLLRSPVICDLDNLENLNSRARRVLRPVWPEGGVAARATVAARWAASQVTLAQYRQISAVGSVSTAPARSTTSPTGRLTAPGTCPSSQEVRGSTSTMMSRGSRSRERSSRRDISRTGSVSDDPIAATVRR